jgi:hypothetical protein
MELGNQPHVAEDVGVAGEVHRDAVFEADDVTGRLASDTTRPSSTTNCRGPRLTMRDRESPRSTAVPPCPIGAVF